MNSIILEQLYRMIIVGYTRHDYITNNLALGRKCIINLEPSVPMYN